MRKHIPLRVALLVVFLLLACASFFLVSVEDIATAIPLLYEGVSMYRIVAAVLFFVAYALAFGFTIPITTILAVAGGALFGLWASFSAIMVASLMGASGVYMLGRRFHHALGERLLGNRFSVLVQEARTHPISFLLSTRFAPLVPFPVAHVVPASAGIPLRDFLWTTILGVAPASFGFALIGDALMHQALGYSALVDVVPLVITGISFICLVPLAIRRFFRKIFVQKTPTA